MAQNDKLVDYLVERIEKIDEKVDELLKFKWQIIGGSVLLSMFLTIAFQVAVSLLKL